MTDFKQLRHFVAVVGTGNFSKASEMVHITQPALTRSIQNLEYEIGVPLLLRQSTGVVPTDAGKLLLERANKILNDWVHTKADVDALKTKSEGQLNIGIATLFAHGMMGHIIQDFRKTCPTATVSVTQGPYAELVGHLLDGNCDILLTTLPTDVAPEGLEFQRVLTVRPAILASRHHPLAQKTAPSAEDFMEANWALFTRASENINYAFMQYDFELPAAAIKTNSLSLLINLVRENGYLTSLAPIIFINELLSEDVVMISEPRAASDRQAGLVMCAKQERRALVEAFALSASNVCKIYRDKL